MAARPRRRRRAAKQRRLRRWLHRQDRLTRGLAAAVITLSVLVVALIALRPDEEIRPTAGTPGGQTALRVTSARAKRAPAVQVPTQQSRREAPAPQPAPPAPPAQRRPSVRGAHAGPEPLPGPRAAIVIDDLGQRLSHFEQLASLDITFSIAVIPGLPASDRTVSQASQRGIEMLLHQPMEPHEAGGKDPGAGVLLTSMSAPAVRAQVRANLAAVPGAVGVNNHMGSRFTEDEAGLGALMDEIKDHGLFWLDSKTTTATRAAAVARSAGVPALERDIFLDAEVNVDFIRSQVRKLIAVARAHGTAVAIGHPHPETIAVLRELRPELLASGVTLVPVSALLRSGPAGDARLALAASPAGKGGPGRTATRPQAATP